MMGAQGIGIGFGVGAALTCFLLPSPPSTLEIKDLALFQDDQYASHRRSGAEVAKSRDEEEVNLLQEAARK